MTWPCFEQNGRHVLRETSVLPSFTQCDDISLCLGRIFGSNNVDFRVGCFIMTPFGCQVTRTSRAVMCISTETRKNVTNHRGQSQNKQSGFERTCPTCGLSGFLVDMRNAYNSVPRESLWHVLDKCDVLPRIFRIVKPLHKGMQA